MKMQKIIFVLMWLIVSLTACGGSSDSISVTTPDVNNNSINKILPLGASRVQGNRPNYESFRYELWKLLKDQYTFDFIGAERDEASYPDASFDRDHAGIGGQTSGQILDRLKTSLSETGSPDIVLFSSPGGNDALGEFENNSTFNRAIYDQALSNIRETITVLQTNNPKVTIFIELMAPAQAASMDAGLSDYFDEFAKDIPNIATEYNNETSQVIMIDMYDGFLQSYLADQVHYNEQGARFVAQRYFDELAAVLTQETTQ
jgi:lysophospholipase L1-like esterase